MSIIPNPGPQPTVTPITEPIEPPSDSYAPEYTVEAGTVIYATAIDRIFQSFNLHLFNHGDIWLENEDVHAWLAPGGTTQLTNTGSIYIHGDSQVELAPVMDLLENSGSIFVISNEGWARAVKNTHGNSFVDNSGIIAVQTFFDDGQPLFGGNATAIDVAGLELRNRVGGQILAEAPELAIAVYASQSANPTPGVPMITNWGLIEANSTGPDGASFGVYLVNNGYGITPINNGGTIRAEFAIYGVSGNDTSADPSFTINNLSSGVIDGLIWLDRGNDTITNDGQVIGDVIMEDGDDVFSGNGSVSGVVDMGFGNDNYSGSANADRATGGRGDDVMSGKGGRDILTGGFGDDVLMGDWGNDGLYGEWGNDTIHTLGGDYIEGGAGSDRVILGDYTFEAAHGGTGFDTLVMASGARNFRLSQMVAGERITSFEQIELQDNQNLSIDDKSTFNLAGLTPLRIDADGSNTIHLEGAWTRGADQTIDDVLYETWTLGNATVLVTETATVTANSNPGYGGFDAVAGGGAAPRAGAAAGLDYSSQVNFLQGYNVLNGEFAIEAEEIFFTAGPQVVNLQATDSSQQSTLVNYGQIYSIQELYSAAVAVVSTGNSRVENYGIITAEQYSELGEDVFYYPTIALQLGTFSEIVNAGEILAYSNTGSAIGSNLGSWFENSGAISAISASSRAIGVNDIFAEHITEHYQTFFNTGLIYAEAGGTGRQAWVENDQHVPEDVAATGVAAQGSLVNDGDIVAVLNANADQTLQTIGVFLMPLYEQFDRSYGVTNNGTIEGKDAIVFKNLNHESFFLYNGYYAHHDYYVTNNGLLIGNVRFEDGNDEYDGTDGEITGTVYGMGGDDIMLGGAFDDSFEGGDGNDTLRGREGIDRASYSQASGAVVVNLMIGAAQDTLGAGVDTLSGIENLTGSEFGDRLTGSMVANTLEGLGGHDRLFGNAGDDILIGGAGNDQMYGGAGADTMDGGEGNDLFVVDNAGDVVIDQLGGYNTVRASIDYVLPDTIQKLIMTGAATTGTGNARNNVIIGTGNDDTLSGLGGADRLLGGSGMDNLSGGNGMDELFGGNDADILDGGMQDDVLWGGSGDDTLGGGEGDDQLDGGAGRDVFSGGAGADTFFFRSASDMGTTNATSDLITDFDRAAGDRINLWGIDADTNTAGNQAFTFIGTAAFSGVAGQLRYVSDGAGGLRVQMDTNGDGVADLVLSLSNLTDLQAADFVL